MSNVNVVGITKPSAYTGCDSVQELVAWGARVSNPANKHNHQTASKLVRYLIKHKHFSPLEMVHVSVEIQTTRDIARQILRHRSFSFQEYSQRYADPTKDLGFVTRETRFQDTQNRQNSIELDEINDTVTSRIIAEEWNVRQKIVIDAVSQAYKWAIANGIAKEQARAILPEGNTESVLIMAGTLRSWIHYIEIRTDKSTQKEHRIIAEKCKQIITQHFPDVAQALDWQ